VLSLPDEYSSYSIKTDKDKFYQILTNLMNNASKFTIKGRIELGLVGSDDGLKFYVEDTGIGIQKEYLDKVFERFWQFEAFSNMKFGGTGLGLSISQGIAELLGMRMEVSSIIDEGSRFSLIVPHSKIIAGKEALPQVAKHNRTLPNSNRNLKILIAEDEDSNYIYLEKLFSHTNYSIVRAENGQRAVEESDKRQFDLVLLDLKMPVMDGFEAARLIKKKYPHIPIIAQTAYSHQEEYSSAVKAGCNAFISKPIDKVKLFALIGKLINEGDNAT
jgi:CheY-like chemotaxis protein